MRLKSKKTEYQQFNYSLDCTYSVVVLNSGLRGHVVSHMMWLVTPFAFLELIRGIWDKVDVEQEEKTMRLWHFMYGRWTIAYIHALEGV